MIVVMKQNATPDEIERIVARIRELGLEEHLIQGVLRTVIGAVGDEYARIPSKSSRG